MGVPNGFPLHLCFPFPAPKLTGILRQSSKNLEKKVLHWGNLGRVKKRNTEKKMVCLFPYAVYCKCTSFKTFFYSTQVSWSSGKTYFLWNNIKSYAVGIGILEANEVIFLKSFRPTINSRQFIFWFLWYVSFVVFIFSLILWLLIN